MVILTLLGRMSLRNTALRIIFLFPGAFGPIRAKPNNLTASPSRTAWSTQPRAARRRRAAGRGERRADRSTARAPAARVRIDRARVRAAAPLYTISCHAPPSQTRSEGASPNDLGDLSEKVDGGSGARSSYGIGNEDAGWSGGSPVPCATCLQSVAFLSVKRQRHSEQPRPERGVSDGRHEDESVVLTDYSSFLIQYTPTISDEAVEHYTGHSGLHCTGLRLRRLVAVAAQKFISNIASDSPQHYSVRVAAPIKDGCLVLAMDDLSKALCEMRQRISHAMRRAATPMRCAQVLDLIRPVHRIRSGPVHGGGIDFPCVLM